MKKRRILLLVVCAAVLLAGIGLKVYTDRYVLVDGVSVPRDAAQADLRGREISASEYEALREKLPDCQITWDVPFQGTTYPSDTQVLKVTALSDEDVAALSYFPGLRLLDAPDCTDYAQLTAFAQARPECSVLYRVTLGGQVYEKDVQKLRLTDADAGALSRLLPYLPQVTEVQLRGSLPEIEELEQLRGAFPHIAFRWEFTYGSRVLENGDARANLSGIPLSYQEADALLRRLPDTKTVDMRSCGLTDQEMLALADAYPNKFLHWNMTIGEVTVSTAAEEIDISNQVFESVEQVEALLPYFPNVKKVIMSHCGFDDETMDALNRRYEDIRFVWSVKIKNVYVRTDATFFYPFKFDRKMTVNNDDIYPLRYCTDMVAIDLGHMWEVTDCEWAAFMPNLTYLILVETRILDLSPLSGLKNLAYLEIFKTRITDLSPLVSCTGLVDLNLCHTYGDYRPLTQMPWLKNVWWNGIAYTIGLPCSGAPEALSQALPDTNLVFYQANSSYRNGWRQLDNYKAMRDVMGMFYLQ